MRRIRDTKHTRRLDRLLHRKTIQSRGCCPISTPCKTFYYHMHQTSYRSGKTSLHPSRCLCLSGPYLPIHNSTKYTSQYYLCDAGRTQLSYSQSDRSSSSSRPGSRTSQNCISPKVTSSIASPITSTITPSCRRRPRRDNSLVDTQFYFSSCSTCPVFKPRIDADQHVSE